MAFAFVFPGQGSQSVGMMAAYGDSPVLRATFDEASETLGQDLWQLVAEGPAELLAQTVNTQPLMLTAAIAAYRLWQEKGGKQPSVVAGHSLGEYSALVAAGVLAFKDAVPLVRLRATAMQEAVPVGVGAMAAILNLDDDKIREACAVAMTEIGNGVVVEPVNFNAPGQTVIAGSKAAVKAVLLDQSVVAGAGNIYADESLFRAGILPTARASEISLSRLKALAQELKAVLRLSIEECGSSIRDYRDAKGNAGAFQNNFAVYGRKGEACRRCGACSFSRHFWLSIYRDLKMGSCPWSRCCGSHMSMGLSGWSAKTTAARLAPEKCVRPSLRPLMMSLTHRRTNVCCTRLLMSPRLPPGVSSHRRCLSFSSQRQIA